MTAADDFRQFSIAALQYEIATKVEMIGVITCTLIDICALCVFSWAERCLNISLAWKQLGIIIEYFCHFSPLSQNEIRDWGP